MAVDARMGFECGVEADQFMQYFALPIRRLWREGTVPVGRPNLIPVVIIPAEVNAEQDVNQSGAQFADRDMRFPTQVHRLQPSLPTSLRHRPPLELL